MLTARFFVEDGRLLVLVSVGEQVVNDRLRVVLLAVKNNFHHIENRLLQAKENLPIDLAYLLKLYEGICLLCMHH